MSDERKVLEETLGMPFVWVFDNNGSPIFVKDEYGRDVNLNYLICNFKYKYDEENDDECKIKIRVVKQEQLNNRVFNIDNKLKVQWGYILPQGKILKSPLRLVCIRDKEKDYKADGITLELICTDAISYLKNIRSTMVSDHDNFGAWLREILNGNYKATRTIFGKTRIIAKQNFKKPQKEEPKTNIEKLQEIPRSGVNDIDSKASTKLIENWKKFLKDKRIEFEWHKDPDKVIKGKSKAISQEIEDRLNEEPGGPYYPNTRDDSINILKRDFNQVPFAKYTYAGGHGELIEFKPKSKVIKTNSDETESTNVDPRTKKVNNIKMVKAVAHKDLPIGTSAADVQKFYKDMKVLFNMAWQFPLNQPDIKDVTLKRVIKKGDIVNPNNDGTTRVASKFYFEYDQVVSAKSLIQTPLFNELKRQAFMENYIGKKIERKYESDAKIIGDPSVISSKVYRFENLSEEDSGNWYCSAVEHEIDEKGYLCKFDLLKKPTLLGTMFEKREYNYGDDQNTITSTGSEDVAFFEDINTSENYTGSPQDIEARLDVNFENERLFNQQQDVALDLKTEIINQNNNPNASEV